MREPDIKGAAAEAWQVAAKAKTPAEAAWLGGWLIHSPHFHPFWQWWSLSVIHLRDIDGVRPAIKHYPEAEYELIILSLNPEAGPPDPDDPDKGYPYLEPPDVTQQFHGISDEQAQGLGLSAVRAICSGMISPDSDYRRIWKDMIQGTVQCIREGGHPAS